MLCFNRLVVFYMLLSVLLSELRRIATLMFITCQWIGLFKCSIHHVLHITVKFTHSNITKMSFLPQISSIEQGITSPLTNMILNNNTISNSVSGNNLLESISEEFDYEVSDVCVCVFSLFVIQRVLVCVRFNDVC